MKKILLAVLLLSALAQAQKFDSVLTAKERQIGRAYQSKAAAIYKASNTAKGQPATDKKNIAKRQAQLKSATGDLSNYARTVLRNHHADPKTYHVDWAKGVIDRKE